MQCGRFHVFPLLWRVLSAWFIGEWSGSTPLHVSAPRSCPEAAWGGTFFAVLLIARVIAYEAYWQSLTVLFSLCLPCALRLPRAKFLSSADILWLVPPIVIYSTQYFARHPLVLLLKMQIGVHLMSAFIYSASQLISFWYLCFYSRVCVHVCMCVC